MVDDMVDIQAEVIRTGALEAINRTNSGKAIQGKGVGLAISGG